MRPVTLAVLLAALVTTVGSGSGTAAGRFDAPLAPAKQPAHVLNRLAFGPRASDLADIKRVGVERWIRQQLEPASIPDSPTLTARLAPLDSQKLATWQIFETFQPPQPQVRVSMPSVAQLLPPERMRQLLTGLPAEPPAVLDALAPDLRRQTPAA